MLDKVRNFNKDYSNIIFLFIMIFILISLIYVSYNNRNKPKECVMPAKVISSASAYSYKIKITSNDTEIAKISVKKYDSKYLIEVDKDDNKDTYYLNYSSFLKKQSNGRYAIFVPNELISGIDNKYYILDYINDLSLNSDIVKKEDRNCYINRKENISMCVNVDSSIELITNTYSLTYTLIENYIDDFDVSIERIELPVETVNTSE